MSGRKEEEERSMNPEKKRNEKAGDEEGTKREPARGGQGVKI